MATPIIIAAMASNRVIGNSERNTLPWPRQQDDMAFFRQQTMNCDILMGHKTFMSLRGIPLQGRNNYILSQHPMPMINGAYYRNSVDYIRQDMVWSGDAPLWVIGGASIYEQFLPLVNTMYLTKFNFSSEGDVFFPEFDESEWNISPVAQLENGTVYRYTRINPVDQSAWIDSPEEDDDYEDDDDYDEEW